MKTIMVYVLLFVSTVSFAEESSTTEDLFKACSNKDNAYNYGRYCLGKLSGYKHSIDELITVYARGYVDGVASTGKNKDNYLNYKTVDVSYSTITKTYGCVRDKTEEELSQAFVKWMKNHPNTLNKSLIFTARQAFLKYFPPPCEKLK